MSTDFKKMEIARANKEIKNDLVGRVKLLAAQPFVAAGGVAAIALDKGPVLSTIGAFATVVALGLGYKTAKDIKQIVKDYFSNPEAYIGENYAIAQENFNIPGRKEYSPGEA
ncbi:hypothetical protein H6503_03030 [Candidatus Woesearchaeota archaeon]|nr:hypothetical protein [Candidatus Woesearchaeota archaeon]